MKQMQARDYLKEHHLRTTLCRTEVLSLFLDKKKAMAHSDLENKIGDQFDRVTLYRTLKTFLEKGLIHKVLDDEGVTKYALCQSGCDHNGHKHNHVHFKCVQCGETNCLENVPLPHIDLPSGYTLEETNVLMQGLCKHCSD